MPLTDVRIKAARKASKAYKLTDGNGLHLLVSPSGAKLWRYRYRIDGRENLFAIGEYPQISLLKARVERDSARGLVKQGIHPAQKRRLERGELSEQRANTFQSVTEEWIGKKKGDWTPYYLRQIQKVMEADVFPAIGSLPIRSVTAKHVLNILERVEKRGAGSVAVLIRQWSSAVFRYAVQTLRADGDPAATLKGAVVRPARNHKRPLSAEQIPQFVAKLNQSGGTYGVLTAMQLLMLTFVRPGEMRAATWSEFDLPNGLWRIPGQRMKMRQEHLVPLSRQAVSILRELRKHTGHSKLLFPNVRDASRPMSGTTMNRRLERMGLAGQFSAHGFRATASSLLNEAGWMPDAIERQLAHKEPNQTRASYNQAQYLDLRKSMMQCWADFVLTGKVTRLMANRSRSRPS